MELHLFQLELINKLRGAQQPLISIIKMFIIKQLEITLVECNIYLKMNGKILKKGNN